MTVQLTVRPPRKSDVIGVRVVWELEGNEWVHFDELLMSPEKQKRIIRENKAEFRSVMRKLKRAGNIQSV